MCNRLFVFTICIMLVACSSEESVSYPEQTSSFNESSASSSSTASNSGESYPYKNDGTLLLLDTKDGKSTYMLKVEILENQMILSQQKELVEIELTVPENWKPRVSDWEMYSSEVYKRERNLAFYGFLVSEADEMKNIVCYNLYGWDNYALSNYPKDVKTGVDYFPQNVEGMEFLQIGGRCWLRYLEAFRLSSNESEKCTDEGEHLARYLCSYKEGVITISFLYKGHDNSERLEEQQEILSSLHFVDGYCK